PELSRTPAHSSKEEDRADLSAGSPNRPPGTPRRSRCQKLSPAQASADGATRCPIQGVTAAGALRDTARAELSGEARSSRLRSPVELRDKLRSPVELRDRLRSPVELRDRLRSPVEAPRALLVSW